jgi:putative spermidine/putrescine transport system ATP-binding protein
MQAMRDHQTRTVPADADEPCAIDARELCKSYDGPLVVDRVSFEVGRGEIVTLLGPSGSGKTSTLMLIAGFEDPNSGDIRLHGRSVLGLSPKERNLGVVFQSYALFPHMSVLDNVAFALRMRGVRGEERRRRAAEMLDRVGLTAFSERRPRQLSGGQQQRVALARALVFEPDALLLDEPLGALDKQLREQLQLEIKSIQQRMGVSIVLVTHDQSEAMMLSDRIAVMHDGCIQQVGSPEQVYSEPKTSFVASFLGETNLLPCAVADVQGGSATIVLADGSRRAALAPESTRPDDRHAISVRPERVRLCAEDEECGSSVAGVLTSRTFLGSSHRFVAQALGREIVATVPDGGSVRAVASGDRVRLAWEACDAKVLVLCD